MPSEPPTTIEGDAVRAAALDIPEHLADPAVVHWLNHYAATLDQLHTGGPVFDTRGKWVRRTQSNTGPGIPGVAHIASQWELGTRSDATALCGVRLRGSLGWSSVPPQLERVAPPQDWAACTRCVTYLRRAALTVAS